MSTNFDGIKQRRFGIEIEMTGITRCSAAKIIKNRKWQIVYDSSIIAEKKNGESASDIYKVEMNSPVPEFEDLYILKIEQFLLN